MTTRRERPGLARPFSRAGVRDSAATNSLLQCLESDRNSGGAEMNTTSATGVAGWVPDVSAQPPVTRVDEARVAAFIATHKLEEWVDAAIRLARDAFPGAKRITLEMFGAPGEYGERLFVDVVTNVTGDE